MRESKSDMDSSTLRKVQLVQLEIAEEIARVCDLNNIKYFLTDGTLLGSIRHKGFIPWDDDLDIGMLRCEYEKFLTIAPSCLNKKYKLVEWKSDSNYPHPMGKIIKRGTVYKESKRRDLGEQGIWVDVFPYDDVLGNITQRTFQLKLLRALIRAKCRYSTWHVSDGIIISKYLKNIPFRIVSKFLKKEWLIKKYESVSRMDEEKKCNYVYENGTDDYKEWIFKKEYLSELVIGKFENHDFYIPKKYNEYLTTAYGDYMVLPPKEQRENRHLIKEIDFGD